jgi:hypothetical protein
MLTETQAGPRCGVYLIVMWCPDEVVVFLLHCGVTFARRFFEPGPICDCNFPVYISD